MHQCLFIDEIIRDIFCVFDEGGHNNLGRLARCCRAWKDPALDNLWRRLPCTAPLFRLIPGILEKDGTFTLGRAVAAAELTIFYSYAIRVKSITHRHRRPIDPLLLSLLQTTFCYGDAYILPKLIGVQIGVSSWDALTIAMGLSPELRHLSLDLGFNKARTDAKGWSNDAVAAEYLEKVARLASLERLDLRGMALGLERMNSALTSMKSLRALFLTTGTSLTVNILAAIAAFPILGELQIHAGHIDAEELADSITAHETPVFPALQVLHIRAQASLVEVLLQMMPSDNLRRLVIEAEQPALAPSVWTSTFSLISVKATNSLRELTIEHHIDSTMHSHFDTPLHLNSAELKTQFTIATLRPLAKLRHLQRFMLDTTVVPDLCDADIEEVAKWWPLIEHLDLGGLISDVDCLRHMCKSRASLRCLESLARLCPRLETLVVNLDIGIEVPRDIELGKEPPLSPHPLCCLTMGSISIPEPLGLSRYLRSVFPSLTEVDGIAAHEEEWRMVQSMLHDCKTT